MDSFVSSGALAMAGVVGCGIFYALTRRSSTARPPLAPRRPHEVEFGKPSAHEEEERGSGDLLDPPKKMRDDLFWLRSDARDDAEVLDLVRHENEFALRKTAHTKPLQ